jgi:soluble lytic murein transglycosylase-like protein
VATTTAKVLTLEEKIEVLSAKYGVPVARAKAIIWCESKTKPDAVRKNYRVDSNGESYVWSRDIGYWQLNTYWQGNAMARMGYNIYNPEQNLEAGFVLYSKEGSKPWKWSEWCWKN